MEQGVTITGESAVSDAYTGAHSEVITYLSDGTGVIIGPDRLSGQRPAPREGAVRDADQANRTRANPPG